MLLSNLTTKTILQHLYKNKDYFLYFKKIETNLQNKYKDRNQNISIHSVPKVGKCVYLDWSESLESITLQVVSAICMTTQDELRSFILTNFKTSFLPTPKCLRQKQEQYQCIKFYNL